MTLGMPLKQRVKAILPRRVWRVLRIAKARTRIVRTTPALARPAGNANRALGCVIAYNRLGGYCVPLGSLHREAAQAIVKGRVWEERTLALIAERAGTGDIVHAGTYYGDFLPALSAACHDGAQVWAFEPGEENHRCAEITLRLNDLHNVTLTRAALGAAEAEASLVTRDAAGKTLGGASHVSLQNGVAGGEPIRIVAIDRVIPRDRKIGVIHLDVEGHEGEALAGALDTIAQWRPLLILETVPPQDWIARHLAPLGYGKQGMVNDNTVFGVDPEAGHRTSAAS